MAVTSSSKCSTTPSKTRPTPTSFFPASSKDPVYEITAQEFDEIIIPLDPRYYLGKEFRIITRHNTPENIHIQRATFNGKPQETFWFRHEDFAKGGQLGLWLGPQPNRNWGKLK